MLVNDLFLLAGLDLNLGTGSGGNTPLHLAALEGMDELASSLLLREADEDALSVLGKTPLMRASRANDGTTPLMSAAWFSRRDPVLALLERGASLTGEDSDGNAALRNVCRKKYKGVAVVVDLL
ncbi:conserved unknown protein [Ectocarpus siliculosus]|uniref:Uncharacterized protein n=1 Tax=Ectocarpus siliculosus TaxID=2880 RepID=D8LS27_ECTSI|nr:conserved unknown protein [Ectocarpus siliculosus]|eukprot:CBN73811.1 conserved unknown protein [Ectocarpus siliculosus]